ncbi:MFS transporter [Alteromonas sp. 5E99-2]|uniref:VC0807 family protein n=1 Tax=Alteromonas sp. 5E99-2 TaxID=2817683 RepID=UPI001A987AEE|nr:VC0807 family protein [Alteromonas sp. 5E99-2]MBO1256523.1 MFS transporter [Alteromonas sp. 5E99-2]
MVESEPKQKPGFLGNLIFNIAIPVLVMTYASSEDYLGPLWSIAVALVFPIGYGLWDLKASGKVNAFSILGIISVLLTGGFSLFKLPAEYIAIKEAAIPAAIGIAVLITQFSQKPLVKVLILNDQLVNWESLNAALARSNNEVAFKQVLAISSYVVASSFFLSSVLNYVLAKAILVSQPGTTAYTEELGRMTALSYPVIVIPSMILLLGTLWFVFSRIQTLTGEEMDKFINQ